MRKLLIAVVLTAASLAHAASHKAILIYSSPECTTEEPCTLIVYRAECPTTECDELPTNHMTLASDRKHMIEARTDTQTIWVVTDDNINMKKLPSYIYAAKVIRWRDHVESPLSPTMKPN